MNILQALFLAAFLLGDALYTREGSCVQLTEQEWDRRGCLRTARPMGPEALPSFLRSLWVKPRKDADTDARVHRVWVVDWTCSVLRTVVVSP